MKNAWITYLCCVVLFSVGLSDLGAMTQETAENQETTADDVDAKHDAIRELRDGLLSAISEKNVDGILKYLHEDVVLTMQDGSELKSVRKHAGVRDYMDRLLTGTSPGVKDLKVDLKVDELTIMHGGDTGVAFGSSNDHYVLSSGGEFDLTTRWSATVVADGNAWQVANLHVSSNLFDNPVVNASKNYLFAAGGIGLGLGLLLGFVLARLSGKREGK